MTDGIGEPFGITRHDDACGEDADLRIIKVDGDPEAPGIRAGDRVVVDISHRLPAAGVQR